MFKKEKILDPTGIELKPGKPTKCKGEKKGCCDECNFFLLCFPEWDPDFNPDCTGPTIGSEK